MEAHKNPKSSRMEALGTRVRQRALSGMEASFVGFILVGYICAGAGLGYLLDSHFRTSYWVPILVVLGAVAGFREMFRTIARLTRSEAARNEQATLSQDRSTFNEAVEQREPLRSQATPVTDVGNAEVEETRPKPRFFAIPPPPQASFEKQAELEKPPEVVAEHRVEESAAELDEESTLFERLLQQDVASEEEQNNEQLDDEPSSPQ